MQVNIRGGSHHDVLYRNLRIGRSTRIAVWNVAARQPVKLGSGDKGSFASHCCRTADLSLRNPQLLADLRNPATLCRYKSMMGRCEESHCDTDRQTQSLKRCEAI